MKSSTTAIFTVATVIGLGTTVWTVATTEPAQVEVVDDLKAATYAVREYPSRIDAWTRAARSIIARDEPMAIAVRTWLNEFSDEQRADLGAEAMIWYAISNELARQEGHFERDYSIPAAVSARKKAIDLLLKRSQTSPQAMQFWHWNSLAWAWVRNGQFRSARGALERTEEGIHALDPTYPALEVGYALNRLASCWGSNGLGDREAEGAMLLRAEPLLEKHAELWGSRSLMNSVALATRIGATGDSENEALVLARATDRFRSELDSKDLRRGLAALVYLYDPWPDSVSQRDDRDAWLDALDMLSLEIDEHGEYAPAGITRHRVGWSYLNAEAESRAQQAWRRWLADQEQLTTEAPRAETFYNLACGRSLTHDIEGAFEALTQSVERGWWDRRKAEGDRDFLNISHDPRFEELLIAMEQNQPDRVEGPTNTPSRSGGSRIRLR